MSARQIAKPKITNSSPDKVFHVVSDRFEHAANLAINSLPQHNAQTHRRHRVESRNRCWLTIEKNSVQQFRRERVVPRSIQRHLVFLLDFVPWMGETLGKLAVICEEKQALGLGIQTSNVEEPRKFCGQQIKNSVAHIRIFPRRNKSGG